MKITKEITDLIKEGKSLNEISKLTGVWKSTLYYHYKKIKGRKFKSIKIDKTNSEKIGEFIGIFAGDGNYYFAKNKYQHKISIYIGLYEPNYGKFVKIFLKRLFSKDPRSYKRVKGGVEIIQYYSIDIIKLIKEYLVWDDNKTKTVRLNKIDKSDKKFLIGFLRGLFDTDGGINKKKNKVAYGTASQKLAEQIKEILTFFDMKPGFYKYKQKDFWYIDLYGERADRFMSLIKPNNSNKILMRC